MNFFKRILLMTLFLGTSFFFSPAFGMERASNCQFIHQVRQLLRTLQNISTLKNVDKPEVEAVAKKLLKKLRENLTPLSKFKPIQEVKPEIDRLKNTPKLVFQIAAVAPIIVTPVIKLISDELEKQTPEETDYETRWLKNILSNYKKLQADPLSPDWTSLFTNKVGLFVESLRPLVDKLEDISEEAFARELIITEVDTIIINLLTVLNTIEHLESSRQELYFEINQLRNNHTSLLQLNKSISTIFSLHNRKRNRSVRQKQSRTCSCRIHLSTGKNPSSPSSVLF